MRQLRTVALFLLSFVLSPTTSAAEFPAGTLQFFATGAGSGVPAPGGGIWVGSPQGLVHFTEAGAGATIATPGGGRPHNLVLAADGSIWFSANTLIARISAEGVVLEQYPMTEVRALSVASDGALWYSRGLLGHTIGRIAGGVPIEFPSPTESWSLAAASNGEMWILGNGFGTPTDILYRMTSTGAVTQLPLGHDVLFGRLQVLPDGTLYIGTGIRKSVIRRPPDGQSLELISFPESESEYLSDSGGNLWLGDFEDLGYIGRFGAPNVSVPMPGDPRECEDIPAYQYQPLALDSTGGLWVAVYETYGWTPFPIPCDEPEPPPFPDLIRIDTVRFLSAHATGHAVPTLSPAMLVALAIALAAATVWHLRT